MTVGHQRPEPIGRARSTSGRAIIPQLRISPGVSDLAVETPLEVEINGVPVARLICTPESLDELVVGWSFGQGYLERIDDIARLTVRNGRAVLMLKRALPGGYEWREQLTAGFDASHIRFPDRLHRTPPKRDDFEIEGGRLLALSAELLARFHALPGGDQLHHAGATDGTTMLSSWHDVSRHNALDKLIGWSILAEQPLTRSMVTLTGRVGASTIYVAARAGIRIVVGREAPTAQAVKLSQGVGLTIVGNLARNDPTIYSHPWRIRRSEE